MTDSWAGNPLTWTTTNISVANMNQEVRDRMDALKQGLVGDASVDADIKQAIKSGTLAARVAASQAGRQYQTTDTFNQYMDSGTAYRMAAGWVYDDMVRTASATITPSKSGHTWAEVSGTWDIVAGPGAPVNFLSNSAATTAVATLDTGSLLDRGYSIHTGLTTHTTQGSIDMGIITKYVDASNLIYVQLQPTALQVHRVIGGSTAGNPIANVAFSPSANTYYELNIEVYGQLISATITSPTAFGARAAARHDDFDHANLAAATKVGFRLTSATPSWTGFSSIAVKF